MACDAQRFRSTSTVTSLKIPGIGTIDPIERTVLQIQGMGELQNPNKVFQSLIGQKPTENFQMFAILHESKYQQTLNSDPSLKNEMDRLHIQSTPAQILDPNNKTKIFNVHVIQYEANHA